MYSYMFYVFSENDSITTYYIRGVMKEPNPEKNYFCTFVTIELDHSSI